VEGVHLKYIKGRLFVSIVFELNYKPYAPKGLMALDVNLRKVAAFDDCDVKRYETEFSKALSKRARALELLGMGPLATPHMTDVSPNRCKEPSRPRGPQPFKAERRSDFDSVQFEDKPW
jgi:hypothetical protein